VTAKSAQENQQLKTLVEQLQAENFILKQTSFTFDFPLDKANDATASLDKNINDLLVPTSEPTTASKSDTLNDAPTEITEITEISSYTPPSSNVSDEESSSPSGDSDNTSERDTSSRNSPQQVPNSSQIEPTAMSPLPAVVTPSSSHSSKPQSAQEFCEKFTDSICKDKEKNNKSSSTGESSRLPSTFTEYRDPTPFTPNIDNPFSESTPLPPLFEDNFQDFGTFEPMATPSEERRNPLGSHFGGSLDEISNKKFLSCNKVWERIQQHPKFDDLEGDEIDQLCSALKAKAKCSGNGPVVPEEELEAVLVKLEDK
jgi:AP-1-like transcription factor